ncbi:hypothetical protein Sango_3050200 [Sesamum angolense]|uniref:Reverse transcriptase domain-containing protein n=1 Tax=Sesamum angolense TaxID=2727404 RepID=A0AAE1TAF2_9LAMI|nr:hypothetical protein Sango_3050200 [Sesamum angolense]
MEVCLPNKEHSRTFPEENQISVDPTRVQPAEELLRIDPSVVVHSLNVDPAFPLVKQKKRHFRLEKDKIIQENVSKLLSARHIREIQFPEWLSNVVLLTKPGVTYQCLADRMFHEQLVRNMEVYIDDMLVKNRQMDQHLADLAEAFGTLRKFHMKLRPAKRAFE